VISSQPSRAAARHIGNYSIAENDERIDVAQSQSYWRAFSSVEQQAAFLSGKTRIEVPSSSLRRRSSVIASKSLRSMARSLRLRRRNLSKIRIASSVDDEPDIAD
jgi:hypothetical protein